MTTKIYVPCDSAAVSVGADEVAYTLRAEANRRGLDILIVRNGSRGALWLEPLVEVETERGRIAYGNVESAAVPGLLDAGLLEGNGESLGLTDEIPYIKSQERLTFARVGITDPVSLDDYIAHGGFEGLKRALTMQPAEIV